MWYQLYSLEGILLRLTQPGKAYAGHLLSEQLHNQGRIFTRRRITEEGWMAYVSSTDMSA